MIGSEKTICFKPYRKNQEQRRLVNEEVHKLLKEEKIKESDSPYLSPIVLVKKPDGSIIFCIDYSCLNMNTIKQEFPILHTQDMFNPLSKSQFFTKLDLEAAYHQIEIHSNDQYRTGFITQYGCFQ